jgi:hypothetical protein
MDRRLAALGLEDSLMFQRISLRGSHGEELFWGFSVLRSDPPPPVTDAVLRERAQAPSNDNAGVWQSSHSTSSPRR